MNSKNPPDLAEGLKSIWGYLSVVTKKTKTIPTESSAARVSLAHFSFTLSERSLG